MYGRENTISDATLEAVERLPVIKEIDETPSLEELSQAIDSLPTGKAPGLDVIPTEVVRSAKEQLLEYLHALVCQCWEEGDYPQDMRGCSIATLEQRKSQ